MARKIEMSIHRFSRSAVLCGLVLAQAAGHAAQYPLAQAPRNTAVKEPAPNVIVSVDNSGSMAWSSRASDGSSEPPAGIPTRLEALKTALRDNFSAANIPNDRIRLSWQAMNNNKVGGCVGFFGDTAAGAYQAGSCLVNGRANANLMRSLDDTHRANFMSWVDALAAAGGTPLHAMMTRAGEYMKTTGQFNPYSDDPGVEGATQSSCRKSFHIFMTDGDYNLFGFNPDPAALGMPAIGNADGTGRTLPDAVAYVPRAPFKDDAGAVNIGLNWEKDASGNWRPKAEYRPTLADMAFHYWASDLQPAVSNNLKKVVAEPGDVSVGTATVPEYWNPKNDPATWQHLSTYTIGFGAASSWTGTPAISANAPQPTYSGDYARLADGSIAWKDPLASTLAANGGWYSASGAYGYYHELTDNAAAVRMDLWHAALNSRGTFTPAANAQALGDAFRSILSQILFNTSTPLTSISASGSRISSATSAYQAGYDTADWSGKLTATPFGSNGKLAATPAWSARELLDARMSVAGAHDSDRKMLSFSGTTAATPTSAAAAGAGVPFRWANLSDAQKAALKGSTGTDTASTALGQGVLDFLRGDRSNEGTGLGLRRRGHVLGDIVDSSVWYTGKPSSGFTHDGYAAFASTIDRKPTVYVGANDGMLHAFNAGTGQEAFAYVPEGVYGTAAAPQLKKLSESTYSHRYYVDGSPFVADIYMGSAADAMATDTEKAKLWKSFLVGTLGAGGKGYFVLDVTKPENIGETHAADVAVIDTTALADDDLGHQFQQPVLDSFSRRALQVAPLNNGRRAVILGNGYNSTSEKAMLWIQYLDGDKSVLKIPAPATQATGTGNGLSAPQVVDSNGDGKVDYVYAGDLLGNLWKFDLSSGKSSDWKATLGSGTAASSLDGTPLFAAGATQPITAAPLVADHPRGGYMVMFGTGRLFAAGDESSSARQYLYGVWDRANGSTGTAVLADLVAQTIGAGTVKEGDVEFRTASSHGVSYSGSGGKRGWYLELGTAGERIVYPGDALSGSAGLFSSTIPGSASNSLDCAPGTSDEGWSMVIDFFSGVVPDGIAYNGSTSALGGYLGFRNHSGRDDIVFRPQNAAEKGKHVICNAAGGCNETELPQAVRRFGWRNLISWN
ncbi:type IV pilus assembly protein PilY1 [Variovorax paradoxus]|uniref:Type IV pilus assembly protein PilY1 n=1 Tax=Variovorax paradoxus TaxID=34073 RepID=A0AAE3Y2Q1_VARPD|nr:PilC/PilY family type IV pilus protein [Variovorax paradoxus]MDR6428512.1 type IV pilus assembly protein PilY1 [Variovorax paradoxus]